MTVPRAVLLLLAAAALVAGDLPEAAGTATFVFVLWWFRPDPPRWWVPWGGPWRY